MFVAVLTAFASCSAQPPDAPVPITLGGAPFTELRHAELSRPVLWPVLDRAGRALTRAWPLADAPEDPTDHPHQRSVWFAHGAVNGIDFWSEARGAGRVEVVEVERDPGEDGVARLRLRCAWRAADGSTVCTDARELTFFEDGDVRCIDYAVTLRASHGPLRLGDTKEGTMAVRVARGLCFDRPGAAGHALSSTGARDRYVWGKRARWVAFDGEVDGARVGIALLDHPQNLRHPTTWHARPYGLLAANPFGLHDFTGARKGSGDVALAADDELVLRYRIVVFGGPASPGRLDEQWRAFAAAPRAQQGEGK